MREPIKVKAGDSTIVLTASETWEPESGGPGEQVLAEFANAVSARYEYSPADGWPGHALAHMVAEAVGGEAILPPVPPAKEGVVY